MALSSEVNAASGEVTRQFDINPYSYALNTSRALDPAVNYTANYAPFNILHELDNNYMDLNVVDVKFQGEVKWKALPELELSALGAVRYQASSQEHNIKDHSNQATAYRKEKPVATGTFTSNEDMTLDWKNLPSGPYVLKASVKDNQGKEVTADTNTVLFSVEDKRPPVETTMWFYGANTEFDAAHPVIRALPCHHAVPTSR